jgi:hypothetical protein
MTNHQHTILATVNMEVAGPSESGAFLVRDTDGRAWLFSGDIRRMGRHCNESVWTPFNVERMNRSIAARAV